MRVLAIEPYFGGSHKAFLDALVAHSRHDWSLMTLPARHWKWRMRSAPVAIMDQVEQFYRSGETADMVFCSDMLDLPTWLGLASRRIPTLPTTPIVTYFHENQWVYPSAPGSRVDHHFAYTNLLNAIASDACWFNSEFNRSSFFKGCDDFLKRMPDSRRQHELERALAASEVLPPGFTPPTTDDSTRPASSERLCIGWVGRFEHDKRPDRFRELLMLLRNRAIAFDLILLGERGRSSEDLETIQTQFAQEIVHDGYADSTEQYQRLLSKMDVVVSTAEHEFFGIAMCEAIWSGAVPVTPNGLSYTEYVPDSLRYETLDQAARIIETLAQSRNRMPVISQCRENITGYQAKQTTARIDQAIQNILCP